MAQPSVNDANTDRTAVLKRTRTIPALLVISLLIPAAIFGQRRVPNNPNYDNDKFHFGFVLGADQTSLSLRPIDNLSLVVWDSTYLPDILPLPDSARIMNMEFNPTPGFVISIVGDMRMGRHFNLRFIPSLAFGDRDIVYTIETYRDGDTSLIPITKRIPSTYINFPLEVKYKSVRSQNFRPYLMGGVQYTLDLASQAKKREKKNLGQKIVKFEPNDIYLEAGVGFDLYNEWFKFGMEIKMMYGLNDILTREHNIYTDGIEKLRSKIFQISFTFE
jgi:hypothetical protein